MTCGANAALKHKVERLGRSQVVTLGGLNGPLFYNFTKLRATVIVNL